MYSVDRLYANSSTDTSTHQGSKASGDAFTGLIPIEDLEITYSRSSGPGGQNVNKVNTKVEIRFHVQSAKWIPESLKHKLIAAEASNITKNGYLIVRSEKTRSQFLNQADCLDRIRSTIRGCEVKPYEPTQEDVDLMNKRQAKARAAMLREKKINSLKKQFRQGPSNHDV